jgi:enamine deaminase RidA (YjgF/YER057c/UK114 family)
MNPARIHVFSGGPWEAVVGYSRAVRVGPHVVVAGTTAATADGIVGVGDPYAQALQALRTIQAALEEAGASLQHVVRTRMFVTDIAHWPEVGRAHGEFFAAVRPAATLVEVSRLIDPALLVEIEAEAIVPAGDQAGR